MNDLKIEVGKFYKTRSGLKVRIYATAGMGTNPVHGAVFEISGWDLTRWTPKGEVSNTGAYSQYDIISEWTEPKPRLLAYRCVRQGASAYGDLMVVSEQMIMGPGWERVPHLDEPETK